MIEVDRNEWRRKRSKTPHGHVFSYERPRFAVGVVGGEGESPRASPVGFGSRGVASAASLARLLACSLVRSLARSLAKPHKKTDQYH